MKMRIFPVLFFVVVAVLLFSFSGKIATPFDFVASLFSSPRALLYEVSHKNPKPTELDLLKQENIRLRVKLVTLRALQKDNNALRNQFEEAISPPSSLLPAKVIGASSVSISPTVLVLDQGAKSGVKRGMAAVSGSILLGKIGKVTTWSSELILVVDKQFSTLGVSIDHNSTGVIIGADDFILFDHVVITDSLSKGETIVSRGEVNTEGIGIPANLILGKVIAINKSESSPFQMALIKSLVDFKKLTTVFIVK